MFIKIAVGFAIVCAMSACSTATISKEGDTIAKEMPEYRTGSIIPRKKATLPDNLQAMTPQQLEEVRRNSAVQY